MTGWLIKQKISFTMHIWLNGSVTQPFNGRNIKWRNKAFWLILSTSFRQARPLLGTCVCLQWTLLLLLLYSKEATNPDSWPELQLQKWLVIGLAHSAIPSPWSQALVQNATWHELFQSGWSLWHFFKVWEKLCLLLNDVASLREAWNRKWYLAVRRRASLRIKLRKHPDEQSSVNYR